MNTRTIAALCFAALSGGCATAPPPTPDPAFAALQRTASQIQDSWALIGAMDKARSAAGASSAPEAMSFGPALSKRVTLRWSGEAGPVIELLTKEANIPFKVTGHKPSTPMPPVYLEVHEARIGDVLRDIGYQLADRVELVMTAVPGQESVEVIYARLPE